MKRSQLHIKTLNMHRNQLNSF